MDHRTPLIVDHVAMREPDLNIGIYDLSHPPCLYFLIEVMLAFKFL